MTLLAAGCSGTPPSGPRPDPAPAVRLVAYAGCDALLDDLRRATVDRVGPDGLSDAPMLPADGTWALSKGGRLPAEAAGPQEHSATNAHEPGADEPDRVKTDGRRIVAVAGGRLRVIDPATRKIAHTLDLPGSGRFDRAELLLGGDRALVLTNRAPSYAGDAPPPGYTGRAMRLTLVDLAGPPKIIGTMDSDVQYLDARQSGSTVRVVVRSEPRIAFPGGTGREDAIEENRVEVWKAPLDAWLPAFTLGDGRAYRAPCDQVSRPSSYKGSSMLTVLTLDLGKGLGDPQPIAVTADGSTVYGNGKSLYVTGMPPELFRWSTKKRPEPHTDIYKFDLGGSGRPRYAASGSVKGFLLNQYAMSEHGGNLRLATTTDRDGARSQSSVHVLAQRGARLDQVGRLDGLGKGERIHAVRFLGATAYVVTFRRTDPLYAVDLTDPRRPRRTGELKITGYSAYLHPAGGGRLLGVGQAAETSGRTTGLQVSLFDVSGAPRRIAAYTLPGATSQVEFDPHAFLYWPKSGLTVVPASRGDGMADAEALVLTVTGSSITRAGRIRQPGGVIRSLVVGDTLWTFSDDGARATGTAALDESAWLPYR